MDDALSSSVMDFRSPTEGDGTGPLVYSLTSISLFTLSSNLFYLPPLLFPSSPSTSSYRSSPIPPRNSPRAFHGPRPLYITHLPHSTLRRSFVAHVSPFTGRIIVNIRPRLPRTGTLYSRTHLLGVLFLGTSIAPQIDIEASTPRQTWVF